MFGDSKGKSPFLVPKGNSRYWKADRRIRRRGPGHRPEDDISYGNVYRGGRPSFDGRGLRCETGQFQAMMSVSLVNQGALTVMLDSPKFVWFAGHSFIFCRHWRFESKRLRSARFQALPTGGRKMRKL